MKLYSTAKPYWNKLGWCSRSASLAPACSFAMNVRVLALVGIATSKTPVIANGRTNEKDCDRSPKPLPKNSDGVHVLKESTPTEREPLPPTATPTPIETIASCASLFRS